MESGHVELIFDHVGHCGRFQIVLYIICAYQHISCGIHFLASVFMTFIPKHTCKPPGTVKKAVFYNFSTWKVEEVLTLLSPDQKDHITVELQDGEVWELTRCGRIWRENTSHAGYEYNGSKHKIPCLDGYVYDQSEWRHSIVSSLNLVCDQKWYAKLIYPSFMLGALLGAILFGYLSDRLGRRLGLWYTSMGIFCFGIASVFTYDYYSFVTARFLLAMAANGYLVVVFVYVMEFFGKKARTWASIHLHTFFAIGIMLVASAGYLINTWWLYQIIVSAVTVPFILCCWLLPESPFWLLSTGKYKEAQEIVDTMAAWNETNTCDLKKLLSLDVRSPAGKSHFVVKRCSLVDMFRTRDMTKRTLIIGLAWFTGSLGVYSSTLEFLQLGHQEYFHFFLLGAVNIPAYIFVCVWSDWVGRRTTLTFFLLLALLFCVVFMVMPQNRGIWKSMMILSVKLVMASTLSLVYLYTAELYPTFIRSLAMGSGSMICHVASIMVLVNIQLSKIWIILPQILVAIMVLLSGMVTPNLPETLNKWLPTTWEEVKQQELGNRPSTSDIELVKPE